MSGFEVVGVILAVPGLIQLVKHIHAAIQEGKGASKEVFKRIERIHAELEKMKLLMDKNHTFQQEQAVQATLRDLHLELKEISEDCNKKYGMKSKTSFFKAIKSQFGSNALLPQLERLEVNLSFAYQNWITELHIRTDSRIASLDGKIDMEAAKVAANRKNIEDGMVELNMNLHKLLEQFHHEPQSGFDLTPIPQEQETFAKSETSPEWQYFHSKFSSLLSALDEFPIATHHGFPLYGGGTTSGFNRQTVSIDDAIRTSLNLLEDIRGAAASNRRLDPTLLLSHFRKLSRYLIYLHQYQESLALHRCIIPHLRKLHSDTGSKLTCDLVSFLGSMALLLVLSGSFGEANDACTEAVKWAESLSTNEPQPLLGLVSRLASLFEPELQKGVQLRYNAVSTYRRLAVLDPVYSNHLAATLSSLGRALLLGQRYDSALESLKEAAKIFQNLEPPPNDQLAVCLTRLAQAYKANGQERESDEVIERATDLIGKQADPIAFSSASWKPQILLEIARVRDGEIVPSSLRVRGVSFSDQLTLQELHLSPPERKFLPPSDLPTIVEDRLLKKPQITVSMGSVADMMHERDELLSERNGESSLHRLPAPPGQSSIGNHNMSIREREMENHFQRLDKDIRMKRPRAMPLVSSRAGGIESRAASEQDGVEASTASEQERVQRRHS